MKLTLHIGLHRTGSTALQRVMRDQRPVLAGQGIAYLGPDALRRPELQPGRDFNDMLAAQVGMAREFAAVIETDARHLVLSEENAIGTMERNLQESTLYSAVTLKLGRFLETLPAVPDHLCFGLRDYAGFWASSHAMCLRQSTVAPTLDTAAVVAGVARRGWPAIIADLRGLLPDTAITVWRHRRDVRATRAVLAVLLGETAAERLETENRLVNTAPNVTALAEWQAARDAAGGARPDREARRALNARLARIEGPPHDPFTPDQHRQLTDRFDADWVELTAGSFGNLRTLDPMAGAAA